MATHARSVEPQVARVSETNLCAAAAQVEAQHSNLQHLNLQNSPDINVHIHTTAKTDHEAKLLLTAMRFPFRPSDS